MFQGSFVALVSPMGLGSDGSNLIIDIDSLIGLVDWHIECATDGLVILGTTAESPTLTEEERDLITHTVIQRVKKQSKRKMPVIIGTGSSSTHTAIKWTRKAMEAGADACLLVTPYYNRPTQEGLYLHFKAIAEAVAIPQILYNVPTRTACDLLPKTVGSLSSVPNIIGIKEATGDLKRVQEIRSLVPRDFILYDGNDATAKDFILAGGNGVISVTANIAPRLVHEMCVAALQGDKEKAQLISQSLGQLNELLFVEANPIPVKWALHQLGRIPAGIRLPLTPLSTMHHAALKQALLELSSLN